MAVRFDIPESAFADPSWEPTDCSVLTREDDRVDMYCHYSERRVAVADSVEEAEAALRLAVVKGMEASIAERGPNRFLEDMLERSRRALRDSDHKVEFLFAD
mgnify:CR=1 FL=1